MNKFSRIGKYIVDVESMYLVNTTNGSLHQFNFDDMVVRKITTLSKVASPIRYDENTGSMMIWKQRRWQTIENGQKAIMYMFNERIESSLLETPDGDVCPF